MLDFLIVVYTYGLPCCIWVGIRRELLIRCYLIVVFVVWFGWLCCLRFDLIWVGFGLAWIALNCVLTFLLVVWFWLFAWLCAYVFCIWVDLCVCLVIVVIGVGCLRFGVFSVCMFVGFAGVYCLFRFVIALFRWFLVCVFDVILMFEVFAPAFSLWFRCLCFDFWRVVIFVWVVILIVVITRGVCVLWWDFCFASLELLLGSIASVLSFVLVLSFCLFDYVIVAGFDLSLFCYCCVWSWLGALCLFYN